MNNNFTPTWLYIKQHNITGLKYFGKTTKDPLLYKGSGKYWKDHIKKHGNDISTVWTELFTDKQKLTEYALHFSKQHSIVESREWANLIDENGIDGNVPGSKISEETRQKLSAAHKGQLAWNKGIPRSQEVKDAVSKANKGKVAWNKGIPQNDKVREAVSIANTGKIPWNKGKGRSEEEKQRMRDGWARRKATVGHIPHNKGKSE